MRKLLAFACVAVAFAQEPIRVNTRLVQITVIAHDKRGAVADLTQSDFEIFDKGKMRQIATFSVSRTEHSASRTVPPAGVYTNRIQQDSNAAVAATVILFDFLNTGITDVAYARKQVIEFLKSADPSTPVAIYSLGNSLRIIQDFTDDRSRLVRATEKAPAESSVLFNNSNNVDRPSATRNGLASNASSVESYFPNVMAALNEPFQLYSFQRRVATTLNSLQAIANRMAGVTGRKNLVWVSGGFPLALSFNGGGLGGSMSPGGAAAMGSSLSASMTTFQSEMQRAAIAIDRANVAIYPVDARGLSLNGSIRTPNPVPYNQATQGRTYNIPTPESLSSTREIDTMRLLANWTGGKAYFNSNDIRGAMKQAAEDAIVTYTLGFYAEEKELDGKYHELKVKTSRKGIDLRHRQGYFASPVMDNNPSSISESLQLAIAGPADSTGIGLTARFYPMKEKPGTYLMTLAFDPANVLLEQKDSKWVGSISFLIEQQSASGNKLDSTGSTVNLNLTDAERTKIMNEGVGLSIAITPAPGLSQLRVAAVDQGGGSVGSLRITPSLQ